MQTDGILLLFFQLKNAEFLLEFYPFPFSVQRSTMIEEIHENEVESLP